MPAALAFHSQVRISSAATAGCLHQPADWFRKYGKVSPRQVLNRGNGKRIKYGEKAVLIGFFLFSFDEAIKKLSRGKSR